MAILKPCPIGLTEPGTLTEILECVLQKVDKEKLVKNPSVCNLPLQIKPALGFFFFPIL